MVEVEVRPAAVDDYAALHVIDQPGTWPSLPPEHAFDVECHEYRVAVVDGQVWNFLQGHHDSTAWAACLVFPAPAETWTCSTVCYFTVHPDARADGLGSALLREFMARARAAGSQWMTMHPAECGTGRGLPPAMAGLCDQRLSGPGYDAPMPEIRPAQPGDHAAVAALWRQYAPGANCTQSDFLSELPTCTVAVEDDVVVGFCLGHHASGAWLECRVQPAPGPDWDCSYLETLVVNADVRGRRIGTALLQDFSARARAAGSPWLLLYPKRGDGRPLATGELLRFCTRAGLEMLEPREDHLRTKPWMMGRPLMARPPHVFTRSTVAVKELVPAA